jgi:hypothetical protein
MGDEKGNDEVSETLPVEQVAPLATASIWTTFDDLKRLDSSIMAQTQVMLAGFLGPKENPTPSVGASPSKASALNPLIPLVHRKGNPLEEKEVGYIGTSTPKGKEDPKDKRDSEGSRAVPPLNNYSPNLPIPMPHIVSQGLPPTLESSCFANWHFLMQSHIHTSSTELWRIIKEGFKRSTLTTSRKGRWLLNNSTQPPFA